MWSPFATAEVIIYEVMPRYKELIKGGIIADIGTGCGILAVKAGQMGAIHVIATDLNPLAPPATRNNWVKNGLDSIRLSTFVSDGLAAIPTSFHGTVDVLIANPPVQPLLLTTDDPLRNKNAYAWNEADRNGRAVLDSILKNGPRLLKSGGKIVTSTSTRHGHKATSEMLDQMKNKGAIHGWKVAYEHDYELAPFYEKYIPMWKELQNQDGDTRIWYSADGTWHHKFMVIEITK